MLAFSDIVFACLPKPFVTGCLMLLVCCPVYATQAQQPPIITIIIDDIGHKSTDRNFSELPPQVAFAILPHAHFSNDIALQSAIQQRNVILHLPLESIIPSGQLGDGALMTSMDLQELHHTFTAALHSVPNAIGVNNHMGSKFTQLSGPLYALMDLVAQHDLFFVDSRTTPFSKVESIAQRRGIDTARRHVFLDHVTSAEFIDRQFKYLIRRAQQTGHALAIGHPHATTLAYLQRQLPLLAQHNVKLVGLQQYLTHVRSTNPVRPKPADEHADLRQTAPQP